ncbi:MAG: biotin transporter BioY [Deinococcales bacterium]
MTQTFATPLIYRIVSIKSIADQVLVVAFASLLIAALAQLRIPLQPVPITGQTLGVFLVALTLGARLGGLAIGLYLLEAALGLPVLAGTSGGLSVLTGATAGYLFGFVLAGVVLGALADRGWTQSPWQTALAMLIGTMLIYIPGLLWLSIALPSLGGKLERLLGAGLYPFLLGDAIKAALVIVLLPSAWRFLRTSK